MEHFLFNMESEESFVVTLKSRPSSPNIVESNREVTPTVDPHSSPKASEFAQPVNENQMDTLLSLMQNVNQQLLGIRQEYQGLKSHVDQLDHKIQNPNSSMGTNHHSPNAHFFRPIHPVNYESTFPVEPNPYECGDNSQQRFMGTPYPFPEMNRNENRMPSPNIPKSHVSIKPQTYDGSEDFDEYLAQFEILVDLHGWDYKTKSLYLASSLTGGARALLNELNETQRRDFHSLAKILNRRYGSVERSEMFRAQLKTKIRGTNESLSELAQSIKKLTRQAYPTADTTIISILALDQFIDALPDPEMRLRLREAKPKDINEAEILAIRLETYRLADAQRTKSVYTIQSKAEYDPISTLKEDNQQLRDDLQSLTREIKTLIKNSHTPTQSYSPKPYGNNTNRGFYQNVGPNNNNFRYQGSPNQRNFNNTRNNYPKNPRPTPFRPQRQGNYPMSNSGVGSRQNQGAGSTTHH